MAHPHHPYRPPLYLWLLAALAVLVGGFSFLQEVTRQNDGSDIAVDETLAAAVQIDMRAAAGAAYALLQTDTFEIALRAGGGNGPIYIARDQPRGDVDAILARLRGQGRYLPVRLALMSPAEVRFARHYAAGGGVGYFTQDGEIHIPPAVIAQWRSADPVERSCAINTLAHEIAHTVSVSPFVFTPAFTDTNAEQPTIPGRRPGESPIASYLIGSAAQCAWLVREGRLAARDVGACVQVFGTAGFNDRCASFGRGEPVRERPGLPPPMRGL